MSPFGLTKRSRVWGIPAGELAREYVGEELASLLSPGSSLQSVVVRPATGPDSLRIEAVRRTNREWLAPWEATLPPGIDQLAPSWREYARRMDQSMRSGKGLLATIEVDGEVAGCVTVGAVEKGAMSQGVVGYWIGQNWAGHGVTSLAVASVIDLVIGTLGLHRLEVNVRPENGPSLGVCRRLGLRKEGYKPRYMCIAGRWADHVSFGVDAQDLEQRTMLQSLADSRAAADPASI